MEGSEILLQDTQNTHLILEKIYKVGDVYEESYASVRENTQCPSFNRNVHR